MHWREAVHSPLVVNRLSVGMSDVYVIRQTQLDMAARYRYIMSICHEDVYYIHRPVRIGLALAYLDVG